MSADTEVAEATRSAAQSVESRGTPAGVDVLGQPRRGRDTTRHALASVARVARTQAGENDLLQIVHGAERVGRVAYKLQRNASVMVRGVVKPPYAATDSLDSLECFKLSEGVGYRVLYDRSALARPPQLDVTSRLVSFGEQARVVHAAPTKLLVVDDMVALLPLIADEQSVDSAVVIRSSAMLTAVLRIFDDLWRFAAPLRSEPEALQGDVAPSEEERWILSLLASGATDATIGRMMGFSARTAHRRVRELITRMGVETRFQAGVQAAKLGWL
ncbi:hypothetical protein DFQ14_101400 [Halopolyspora algeriensis]|uniref:HTH luxR-type domain-containing protein n=1 Tax=Halopolyspora algeriensis TaxID=1500506 RepID=A0A368VXX7_9ACTN|nr:DNA-binding response regulator [Halopolyspora algeriensis]RCW47056.1 hypothetical protein DFQ14_101400 [Halopolyspora algeriensis]TQM48143.1 hypothetical protein FHU43_3105 [Halopolyspora algeriensis]